MPAHKRPPPPLVAADDVDLSPATSQPIFVEEEKESNTMAEMQAKNEEDEEEEDKDGGGDRDEEEDGGDGSSDGSSSEWEEEEFDENDPYMTVRLTDIRKEVQCPICLGIIRKTRTVMECLHRFCRECIDKSMRLGNNECPACRTHCASRRSLRDDPNYDALIATLYPDIDKYEEEELALHEEDKSRNKKIQAYIAETFHRQSEALGRRKPTAKATAAAFARRSQGNYRNHGRGRSSGRDAAVAPSDDDDEEEANGNDGFRDYSSTDEPSPDRRQKKRRRRVAPRSSPAMATGNSDVGCEDNDDFEINRENSIGASPLRTGSREMLAWGKNGTRSQTRHGSAGGLNGRILKGGRITKLVEYLHTLNVNDDELDVQLILVPLDKERTPNLEQPYLCCQPTLSIRQLSEFIARQTSLQAEEIQIYSRENQGGSSTAKPLNSTDISSSLPLTGLKVLGGQESLGSIYPLFTKGRQGLELIYHLKGKV